MIIKGSRAPVSSQPINHNRGTSFNSTSAPGGASKYITDSKNGTAQRHYPGLLPKLSQQERDGANQNQIEGIRLAQIFDNSFAQRTGGENTGKHSSANPSRLNTHDQLYHSGRVQGPQNINTNLAAGGMFNLQQQQIIQNFGNVFNMQNGQQRINQTQLLMSNINRGGYSLNQGSHTGESQSDNRRELVHGNEQRNDVGVGVGAGNYSLIGSGTGNASVSTGGGFNTATAEERQQIQMELANMRYQQQQQHQQNMLVMTTMNFSGQDFANGQAGILRGTELTSFFTTANQLNYRQQPQQQRIEVNPHTQYYNRDPQQTQQLGDTQSMTSPLNAIHAHDNSQHAENSTIHEREIIQGILNHDYTNSLTDENLLPANSISRVGDNNASLGQNYNNLLTSSNNKAQYDHQSAESNNYTILKAKLFQPNIKDEGLTAATLSHKMMQTGVGGVFSNSNLLALAAGGGLNSGRDLAAGNSTSGHGLNTQNSIGGGGVHHPNLSFISNTGNKYSDSPNQKAGGSGNYQGISQQSQVIQSQQFQVGQISQGLAATQGLNKQQTLPSHFAKTHNQGNSEVRTQKEKEYQLAKELRMKKDRQQVKFYQTLTNQLTSSSNIRQSRQQYGTQQQPSKASAAQQQLNLSHPSSTAIGQTNLNTSVTTSQLKQDTFGLRLGSGGGQENQTLLQAQLNYSGSNIQTGGQILNQGGNRTLLNSKNNSISKTRAAFSQQPISKTINGRVRSSGVEGNRSNRIGIVMGQAANRGYMAGTNEASMNPQFIFQNQGSTLLGVNESSQNGQVSSGQIGLGGRPFTSNTSKFHQQNLRQSLKEGQVNQAEANPYDVDSKIQYSYNYATALKLQQQQKQEAKRGQMERAEQPSSTLHHHSTQVANQSNLNNTDQTMLLEQQTEHREDTQIDEVNSNHQVSHNQLILQGVGMKNTMDGKLEEGENQNLRDNELYLPEKSLTQLLSDNSREHDQAVVLKSSLSNRQQDEGVILNEVLQTTTEKDGELNASLTSYVTGKVSGGGVTLKERQLMEESKESGVTTHEIMLQRMTTHKNGRNQSIDNPYGVENKSTLVDPQLQLQESQVIPEAAQESSPARRQRQMISIEKVEKRRSIYSESIDNDRGERAESPLKQRQMGEKGIANYKASDKRLEKGSQQEMNRDLSPNKYSQSVILDSKEPYSHKDRSHHKTQINTHHHQSIMNNQNISSALSQMNLLHSHTPLQNENLNNISAKLDQYSKQQGHNDSTSVLNTGAQSTIPVPGFIVKKCSFKPKPEHQGNAIKVQYSAQRNSLKLMRDLNQQKLLEQNVSFKEGEKKFDLTAGALALSANQSYQLNPYTGGGAIALYNPNHQMVQIENQTKERIDSQKLALKDELEGGNLKRNAKACHRFLEKGNKPVAPNYEIIDLVPGVEFQRYGFAAGMMLQNFHSSGEHTASSKSQFDARGLNRMYQHQSRQYVGFGANKQLLGGIGGTVSGLNLEDFDEEINGVNLAKLFSKYGPQSVEHKKNQKRSALEKRRISKEEGRPHGKSEERERDIKSEERERVKSGRSSAGGVRSSMHNKHHNQDLDATYPQYSQGVNSAQRRRSSHSGGRLANILLSQQQQNAENINNTFSEFDMNNSREEGSYEDEEPMVIRLVTSIFSKKKSVKERLQMLPNISLDKLKKELEGYRMQEKVKHQNLQMESFMEERQKLCERLFQKFSKMREDNLKAENSNLNVKSFDSGEQTPIEANKAFQNHLRSLAQEEQQRKVRDNPFYLALKANKEAREKLKQQRKQKDIEEQEYLQQMAERKAEEELLKERAKEKDDTKIFAHTFIDLEEEMPDEQMLGDAKGDIMSRPPKDVFTFMNLNFDLPTTYYQSFGDFNLPSEEQRELLRNFMLKHWPAMRSKKVTFRVAFDLQRAIFNVILLGKNCPLSKCCKMTVNFQFDRQIAGGKVICMETLCPYNPIDQFFMDFDLMNRLYSLNETYSRLQAKNTQDGYANNAKSGRASGYQSAQTQNRNRLALTFNQETQSLNRGDQEIGEVEGEGLLPKIGLKPKIQRVLSNEVSKSIQKGIYKNKSLREVLVNRQAQGNFNPSRRPGGHYHNFYIYNGTKNGRAFLPNTSYSLQGTTTHQNQQQHMYDKYGLNYSNNNNDMISQLFSSYEQDPHGTNGIDDEEGSQYNVLLQDEEQFGARVKDALGEKENQLIEQLDSSQM